MASTTERDPGWGGVIRGLLGERTWPIGLLVAAVIWFGKVAWPAMMEQQAQALKSVVTAFDDNQKADRELRERELQRLDAARQAFERRAER